MISGLSYYQKFSWKVRHEIETRILKKRSGNNSSQNSNFWRENGQFGEFLKIQVQIVMTIEIWVTRETKIIETNKCFQVCHFPAKNSNFWEEILPLLFVKIQVSIYCLTLKWKFHDTNMHQSRNVRNKSWSFAIPK